MMAALAAIVVATAVPRPAEAIMAIDDRLPAFLVAIGEGTGYAWSAFEAANAKDLDQLFYRDRSPTNKLQLARQNVGRWVPVAQLAYFSQRWRSDFEVVASRLEPLTGTTNLRVSMWYCMDTRPWVYVYVNGQPTLALNARHMLPYDQTRTKLRFAEAFFSASATMAPDETAETNTFSRRVQIEGLRLALMQRAVPGLPLHRYLNVSPKTFATWQRNQRAIARGLLQALDGPESGVAMERFFGRGYGDPWPAGAGRFVSFLAAAGAAREHNPVELGKMPSRDYLFLVRPMLEDMAKVDEGLSPW
jgi:hypothetical protein